MKLITISSRWTNASRSRAVHILKNENVPLCKNKGVDVLDIYEGELKDVTCKRCASKHLKQYQS